MSSLYYPPHGGPGLITLGLPAAPGAGVEPTLTVPAGRLWRMRSWTGLLTCAAGGVNRQPFARAQTFVPVVFARCAQSVTVAPGAAASFCFALGLSNPATGIATAGIAGLWDVWLSEGQVFAIITAGFAAGDAWTSIAYSVEELIVSD